MPRKFVFSPLDIEQMKVAYASGQSFTDLAVRYGCGKGTIRLAMLAAGVVPDVKRSLSTKMLGRPSGRRGKTHTTEARAKMSASRRSRGPTTLGKVYTEEERSHISSGLKKHYAENGVKKNGVITPKLSGAERIARNKTRDAMKRMVRRVLVMARVRKDRKTETMLGYTKQQLREHLESQFADGMEWGERDSFHIDHIVPVAEFFRRGIFEVSAINALSNLQVLSPDENRRKSDRVAPEILTAHFDGSGHATYTKGLK